MNDYYKKQKTGLLHPNEDYINSVENTNKADLKRFEIIYNKTKYLSGRMLDIGCNDGFFMRNFNWLFQEFIGIDMFSIEEYTNGKFKNNKDYYTKNGKINYITSLLEDIDTEKLGKFDFIFAGEIIEHLEDKSFLFKNIKKLLKPNGCFVITTPNNIGITCPEHYRQYSSYTLKDETANYFSDTEITFIPMINDSWPFLMLFGINDLYTDNLKSAEKFMYDCAFDGLCYSFDTIKNEYNKPYPEVTGYLLTYMCQNNYDEKKLIKIADNLLKYQNKNGGFPSFNMDKILFAFDTSQILIGLCEMYKRTNNKKYFNSAIKAGEFLIASQLENGAFVPIFDTKTKEFILDEKTYQIWNGPFSGLMCKLNEGYQELYNITGNIKYLKRIKLTTSFYEKQPDIECTHPMGYFLEGLWAGGKFDLVREKIQKLVLPRLHENGYIAYTEKSSFAYVSGTIQLGILMYKTGFIQEAKKVLNYGRLVFSKSTLGGLFQYADKDGNLDTSIHGEINSWGTKYYCELERLLKNA